MRAGRLFCESRELLGASPAHTCVKSDPSPTKEARERQLEAVALRCQLGEKGAWDELIAHFERPLFYYARRLVRSQEDAVQVLQDTWVRAFHSLPSLDDPARLAPWLYTLARRAASAYRAEGKRREALEAPETLPLEIEAEGSDDIAGSVHAALGRLGPESREVLTLFYLDDLSLADMAAVIGIPLGTVKSRIHTAKRELRDVLTRTQTTPE